MPLVIRMKYTCIYFANSYFESPTVTVHPHYDYHDPRLEILIIIGNMVRFIGFLKRNSVVLQSFDGIRCFLDWRNLVIVLRTAGGTIPVLCVRTAGTKDTPSALNGASWKRVSSCNILFLFFFKPVRNNSACSISVKKNNRDKKKGQMDRMNARLYTNVLVHVHVHVFLPIM